MSTESVRRLREAWDAIDILDTPAPRVMAPKKTYPNGPYKHDRDALYKRSTGELVAIMDMDDAHLLNAIGKIERYIGITVAHRNHTYRCLVADAIYRGLAYGEIENSGWDSEENN